MVHLDAAIADLAHALHHPPVVGWSWLLRQRMAAVREALHNEPEWVSEAWLASRASCLLRSRHQLAARLNALGPQVMQAQSVQELRPAISRLLHDLHHHRQRISDLIYDSVELELGGSE